MDDNELWLTIYSAIESKKPESIEKLSSLKTWVSDTIVDAFQNYSDEYFEGKIVE